ncbi:MAG: ABC transporter permease, partial [Burkholderiales bacterium]|nr:ABC transporter permease [Burkholderiales bacterium]
MATLRRLWRNAAVKTGTIVLSVLVLLALFAPWLGTIDPAEMDASFINVTAGSVGEVTIANGETM